jgi:hypothetical protein
MRHRKILCCLCFATDKVRLGSPSSRLGRALGSQNTRLRQRGEHDRDHSAERKD